MKKKVESSIVGGLIRRTCLSMLAGLFLSAQTATVFAQTAALVPNASQQFFNSNGQPLAGGSVYFYVPNTTTPKTTWFDANQTVPNTNPLTLNAGGYAPASAGGGAGGVFGQGNYRQIVKDANNNTIWDGFTAAYGALAPSGATGTDTAPVGTLLLWAGYNFNVPVNWALAYGQALSRTTYAQLLTAISVSTTTGNCVATSTTIIGFADTSQIHVGSPIESACLPTSTTVTSITNATTVVVSQAATATGTFTVTAFPWGNGDGVTTFNLPDLRGRVPPGADAMGGTAANRLTSGSYGASAAPPAVAGGVQSQTLSTTLLTANFPPYTPAGTVGITSFTATANNSSASGGGSSNITTGGLSGTSVYSFSSVSATTSFTGTPQGGTSTPIVQTFPTIQPSVTFNWIIKLAPNSTGAGGVVSFGGMFGDIVCASTLTCAPVGSPAVNTVGCTTGTTSQLGCVSPDGSTITAAAGVLSAHGVAQNITVGTTAVAAGVAGQPLSISGGVLSQIPILPIANGGTGASTQQGALNAIMCSPTRTGDVAYWNGSNWVCLAGNNSGSQFLSENSSGTPTWTGPAVNAQTGTSYTVVASDFAQLVTFNNSATVAVTLPQATGAFSKFNTTFSNLGTGAVVITPTTSTINGLTSFVLPQGQEIWIVSDGTNYQTVYPGMSGKVTVQRVTNPTFETSRWVAYGPGGKVICDSVISGSTTSCMAEGEAVAVPYALGSTLPGYNMEIIGGYDPAPNGTKYNGAAVLIPMGAAFRTKPMQGGKLTGSGLTMNCTLSIDSAEFAEISFEGTQTSACVSADVRNGLLINPTNPSPYDLITAFGPGRIFVQSVNGGAYITGGMMQNSSLRISELNVSGVFTSGCVYKNDTASAANFEYNHVTIDFLHGFNTNGMTAMCIGTAAESGGFVNGYNVYDVSMGPDSAGKVVNGIDSYGHDDTWTIRATNFASANYIIKFESGSCRNHVTITNTGTLPATPVVDSSGCTGANANVWLINGNQEGATIGATAPAPGTFTTLLGQAGNSTTNVRAAGRLTSQLTPTGNGADTTEDILQTFNLPANTFDAVGRCVDIKAWGTTANNADNKTMRLYFGAVVFNTGASAFTNGSWMLSTTVCKTGSNTQSYIATGQFTNSLIGTGAATLSQTDTAAITIKVTGQAGTANANDIVANGMTVVLQN